jgi:hypothetical protein
MIGNLVVRLALREARKARAAADALDADEPTLTPNPHAASAHLSPGQSALVFSGVVLVLAVVGTLMHVFG